jgi:lysine 2,3-aminomutase
VLQLASPTATWQEILRENFTSWPRLIDYLQLTAKQQESLHTDAKFPLNLPRRLAEKIVPGTLDDPILRQFLPTVAEMVRRPGFVEDPVQDATFCESESRLLRKYSGRALLLTTKVCAMHCRFCFRQHYAYQPQEREYAVELKLIAEDPSITEVILSGGDPLSLSNQRLETLFRSLESIDHVKLVRFHTRFPVGIPERIDPQLLKLLAESPLQFWFVLHVNHPTELDDDVIAAMQALQRVGVPVLTQTVLLRGVNDRVEVLKELVERLIFGGIRPYYLHQLDPVAGGGHFEVTREEGLALVEKLRKVVPGYAVPRYVEEIPGKSSKSPVKEGV